MNKATQSVIQSSKSFSPFRPENRLQKAISQKASQSIIIGSNDNDRMKRKQKTNLLNKSIEEQVKKAKEICRNVKSKNENLKTSTQTNETATSTLNSFRENGKIVENHEIFRKLRAKHLSIVVSAPKECEIKPKESPKKPNKSPKKKITSLLAPTTDNLEEVRELESFMMDEEEEDKLDMSIVEGHGAGVLDWGVCMGKATEFRILKFLDEGKYGKVYLAQSHRNHMIYSVKSIYRSTMEDSTMHQLLREVKIQTFLDHPHIVKLYNFFVDDDSAYLVLQPCLGRNLYQNLKDVGKVPQKTVKEWIRQICTAIEYMHANDIIHRDLKPQNILLHENMIKICDFGWAIHSPLLRNTQCGTPIYTPPEVVSRNPYDSKIDIWSIGVLTYELLYGTIPFQIRHLDDMVKIIEQQVYFSNETVVSEAAKDFMMSCLHKNPIQRASIRQLLEHEFLNRMQKFRSTII